MSSKNKQTFQISTFPSVIYTEGENTMVQTFTLTDEQVRNLSKKIRDKMNEKARKTGERVYSIAGEATAQMVCSFLEKHGRIENEL